jgi:hypothetical protein
MEAVPGGSPVGQIDPDSRDRDASRNDTMTILWAMFSRRTG